MSNKIDTALERVYQADIPDREDVAYLLTLENKKAQQKLFHFADKVRRESVGEGILVRGIVEFSNFCRNACAYCGLQKNNSALARYRLSRDEIMEAAGRIAAMDIKTVVLQSGEDELLDPAWLSEVITQIKNSFDMAVTLSVGERNFEDYQQWKKAGADRYLLKIETSNAALYRSLHPGMDFDRRLRCLDELRALGFQVGSGNIIGLKGQSIEMIADDVVFFARHCFDMIGIGPFIPHVCTALNAEDKGDVSLTLRAIALTRIAVKRAHIPATTALGSVGGQDYRVEGFKAGADVVMLNFTPAQYRDLYQIYPGKKRSDDQAGGCSSYLRQVAKHAGRDIDYSRGDSLVDTPGANRYCAGVVSSKQNNY